MEQILALKSYQPNPNTEQKFETNIRTKTENYQPKPYTEEKVTQMDIRAKNKQP